MKYRKVGKYKMNIGLSVNDKTNLHSGLSNSVKSYLIVISLILITVFITWYELQVLRSEQLIQEMISEKVDYESFRNLKISDTVLKKTQSRVKKFLEKNPSFKDIPYVDNTGYLTFCMMANSYKLTDKKLVEDGTFRRGIIRLSGKPQFKELYGYYKAIIDGLKYFPVPMVADQSADVSYVDSWYQPRSYGGKRKHEGTDLMASNNKRGFFPVISITDGTVDKMGWLEQGGYRIGIKNCDGGYFYYAHLASYSPQLKQGDTVIAGQLLGFMGDSGYGSEGTVGKFDVHLHLGIYVNTDQGEMSVNPYWILKMLENNRTVYKKQ